jgi:hypothetical protein
MASYSSLQPLSISIIVWDHTRGGEAGVGESGHAQRGARQGALVHGKERPAWIQLTFLAFPALIRPRALLGIL